MPSPSQTVAVVIPARYGSTRFPGKPLVELAGKPLIQHVYEALHGVPRITDIRVVTDDHRIMQAVTGFGGQASFVDGPCRTGTDRVAKVATQLDSQVIMNLQADEIPLHPGLLGDLIDPFLQSKAQIGTLKRRITSRDEFHASSVVKVVTNEEGEALYFSRSPIPHCRDQNGNDPFPVSFVHLGIYIFRRDTLLRFSELPTGVLEEKEKLEQLRALEHGIPIRVWETTHPSLRIDHVEDLQEASLCLSKSASC